MKLYRYSFVFKANISITRWIVFFGVWDVELQTVLEINKLGHRRRILQSIAFIKYMREPKSAKTPLAENNETNKISLNATTNKDGAQRQSISGYRKNRFVTSFLIF